MQANEPYQRVDDGILNGATWGAGIGAAVGAGAMGGSYLHMKGIPKRTEKTLEKLQTKKDGIRQKVSDTNANYQSQMSDMTAKRASYSDTLHQPGSGRFSRMTTNVKNSMNERKRNSLDKAIGKIDQAHEGAIGKLDKKFDKVADRHSEMSQNDYVSNKQSSHMYSKHMNGWGRKAMIGGAATALGAGIGALSDKFMD